MENSVNETRRTDTRKNTDTKSLVLFVSVYVVAFLLLIYNGKQHDSTLTSHQNYFWNIKNPNMLFCIALSNGFLIAMLIIFKNSTNLLVWGIFSIPLTFMCLMIAVWIFMILENATYEEQPLWISIVLFSILAVLFGSLLNKFRVDINLVIEIIKESLKGLDDVKYFMFIPILNSFMLIIPINIYFFAYEHIKYKDSQFTVIWITISLILFLFLMDELQKFLIAGVTSKLYFTRDKTNLRQLNIEILVLLLKYHLGSVCYGAMIKFFRPFSRFFSNIFKTFNLTNSSAIISASNWFDAHTESNNAYFLVLKDRTSYYESGRQLYILHSKDLINANRIRNTKNLIIFIIKLFFWSMISIAQVIILENGQNTIKWTESNAQIFITLLFIFCMVNIYIDFIDTITDTTLVCACIDFEQNDGNLKPFFMSESLEDFVQRLRIEHPQQFLEVSQSTVISTIYNPTQQNCQNPQNIVYLKDLNNQVNDELIPIQNFQPTAPQLD